MRQTLLCSLLLLKCHSLQAALDKADTTLITQTSERAAYVESLTEFCSARHPSAQATNEQALLEWRKRNYWNVFQEKLAAQSQFTTAYSQLRTKFSGNLNANPQKMDQLCTHVPQLLRYPDFDPSSQHGADLARIASLFGTNNPSVSNPPTAPSANSAPLTNAEPSGPTVTAGQEISAGDVTFAVPANWRVTQSSPEAVDMVRSAKYGGRSVVFAGIKPANGDVEQSLRAVLHAQLPNFKLQNMRSGISKAGVPAAFVKDYGPLNPKLSAELQAVGFLVNGHLQVAQFMSTARTSDSFEHEREFESMVESWRFRNVPAGAAWDPLSPPSGSGGLNGVYMGSQLQNQLNPLGGMDLRAIRTYLVLLKNGQAYRGLPNDGHVLDINFATALRSHPNECGTYKVEGKQIVFRWLDNFGLVLEQRSKLERGNGRTTIDLGTATVGQVAPVNNLMLSGRYTSTFYMGGSMARSSTSVVSQTFIAFAPDGTYEKSGFASSSFSNSGAGGTVSSQRGVQAGHYTINGYTLTLTPQNGQSPELFTILFEEISSSPKAIFINDNAFMR